MNGKKEDQDSESEVQKDEGSDLRLGGKSTGSEDDLTKKAKQRNAYFIINYKELFKIISEE